MEDILYDYHLAEAINKDYQIDANTEYKTRLSVLKKHGITQTDFDSSMVYYTRHVDQIKNIYANISQRFENEKTALGGGSTSKNIYTTNSLNGDTTNIWTNANNVILTPNIPYNTFSFNQKADTTFHKGDILTFAFNAQYLLQDGKRTATALFALKYNNDSITYQNVQIENSDHYSITLSDNKNIGIKQISGYIMFNKDNNNTTNTTTLKLLSVNDIYLIRIHNKNEKK